MDASPLIALLQAMNDKTLLDILQSAGVGSRVSGEVTESLGQGQYRVAMGGRSVVVASPVPLEPGEIARFQIRSTTPSVTLELVPREVAQTPVSVSQPEPDAPLIANSGTILESIRQELGPAFPELQAPLLEQFVASAQGHLPLDERTLFVAILFVRNGIVPSPKIVEEIATALFSEKPLQSAKSSFSAPLTLPADPLGNSMPGALASMDASLARALGAIFHPEGGQPSPLGVLFANIVSHPESVERIVAGFLLTRTREILSQPDLAAFDKAIAAVEVLSTSTSEQEGKELVVVIRDALSELARSAVPLPKDVMVEAENALVRNDISALRGMLTREEQHVLARAPEIVSVRNAILQQPSPDAKIALDVVNGLARNDEKPFFFTQFALPFGDETVPVRLKVSFRKRRDRKHRAEPDRVVIDLDLERLSRVVTEIALEGRRLSLTFWLARDDILRIFLAHLGEIESSLTTLGFHARACGKIIRRKPHVLLDDMPSFSLGDKNLDVRV